MKNFVPLDGPKKTIIRNDWLKEFPDFRKKRECSIGKIVGPVSVSVGWEIRYKEYRAGSSVCNLMNVEKSLYASLTIPDYKLNALSWEKHEKGLYMEAVEEIKKNSPIPLEGPLTLSQLLEAYDYQATHPPFWSPSFLEDPVLTAAWAGKKDLAYELSQNYSNLWKKNIDHYDEEKRLRIIALADTWHQNILSKISNQGHLNALIEEAIIKYKLQKLPQEELIIDF